MAIGMIARRNHMVAGLAQASSRRTASPSSEQANENDMHDDACQLLQLTHT